MATTSPTVNLRNLIKSVLNDAGDFEVYADEAPKTASYPYVVFEVSRNSAEDFPFVGYLEVNAWDKYKTYSRVDDVVDQIERKLRFQYYDGSNVAFRCFNGDREHLPDTDESIKRTREKFMIRYSVKGE